MFFNKLKEEIEDCTNAKLANFAEMYSEKIIESIEASSETPERLIKKYKHAQWFELNTITVAILKNRFNLVKSIPFAFYKGDGTVYSINDYVGDTLSKAQKKIEKQEKIKDSFSKTHPPIVADVYGNTMKFEDFKAIEKIKSILENQKSTVKAVKEIKEVLKEVE